MKPAATVAAALNDYLPSFDAASHIYVAYSGGMDSHVLLHGLSSLIDPSKLTALHINHKLSTNADNWAEHCRAACQALGVNFIAKEVTVSSVGSRENAAREARYQAFEAQLQADELLVLAHHAEDQAETVLYRLLRGSGPRGLAGMPVARAMGDATLLRPLLRVAQQTLDEYARNNRLQWIEDESNKSRQFDRNILRHDIIPHIKTRWPGYALSLADAAMLCEQAERTNEDMALLDLHTMALRDERLGCSIDIQMLSALSNARQANVLRFLVRLKGRSLIQSRSSNRGSSKQGPSKQGPSKQAPFIDSPMEVSSLGDNPPGHRIINEVLSSLLNADKDRNPRVAWSGGEWRRYRQRLYLLAPDKVASSDSGGKVGEDTRIPWPLDSCLLLPDGLSLEATPVLGAGIASRYCDDISVRFRSGGERCRPAGRGGSASFKKLFQESSLEPWLRDKIPLIYCGEDLIAVGDLWVCEGFQAAAGEPGQQLRWQ